MDALTLNQSFQAIEAHAKEAYTSFNVNSARKCTEAVAALIARHSIKPENANKLQTALADNKMDHLLQIILDENLIGTNENTRKKVMAYFKFLQTIGNVGSHNVLLDKVEKVACVQVMNCLIVWLYEDFLLSPKPAYLEEALKEQVIAPLEKAENKTSILQKENKVAIGGDNHGAINIG